MSEVVCFFYKTFIVGGAELLMLKMSSCMASTGVKVVLICHDIDEVQKRKFLENDITIEIIENWGNRNQFQIILNRYDSINCVVFTYDDYLKIKSIYHLQKKTVFYAIHYMSLTMEQNRALFRFRRAIMKRVVCDALKNNALVCMDEQTVRFTQGFYAEEERLYPLYDNIVRICVDVPDTSSQVLLQRTQGREINILTIARADFPFKGYLTGLVDSFQNPWISKQFTLNIVSYGEGVPLLQQHINALPEDVRSRIVLHGKMDYAELEPFFERTQLYIGMGTTILDAASRGVISIPVKAYTHDICCDHFFHEDYRAVAIDNGSRKKYEELLQRVSGMSPEEYLEASNRTIAQVKEHYDVRSTSTALLRHFEKMR